MHLLSKGVCHFSFVVFRRLFFFHETLQIFFWYCFFHGLTFRRHFEIFRESLFSYKWLLLIFYTWNLIDKFNKIFWFMIIYLMIFQVFYWKWRCFWGFEWYTELNIFVGSTWDGKIWWENVNWMTAAKPEQIKYVYLQLALYTNYFHILCLLYVCLFNVNPCVQIVTCSTRTNYIKT